jgi:predicted Rdx family selenoprotein
MVSFTTVENINDCIKCDAMLLKAAWFKQEDHRLMKMTTENVQLATDVKNEAVITKRNELSEAVTDLEKAMEDNSGVSKAWTVVKRIKDELIGIQRACGVVNKTRLKEAGVADVQDKADRVLRLGSKRWATAKSPGAKGVTKKRG